MKKIIVIIAVILSGIFVFASCATTTKCAAYGHYSEILPSQVDDESI